MVVSAGNKGIGTNSGYKHPRLSTVRNLLDFAGDYTNGRYVDVYDKDRKVWARKGIWGKPICHCSGWNHRAVF